MTDRTHPDSGRIITSGDVIAELHDRVAELEAQLEAVGAGGVQALAASAPVAPAPQPASKEWRNVLPGGRITDKWDSARLADYNSGWNDYRRAAATALEKIASSDAQEGKRQAAQWLRDNYQDYPNIASLCDSMLAAAPPAPSAQDAEDAERYRWLAKYLVSDDESHDDALVAATTVAGLDYVIDAAMKGTP